jgi:hypothetical protein
MPARKKQPVKPVMHSLSDKEIRNPHLVIDELFDFAEIEDLRTLLWKWFSATVTGSFPKQLTRTERTVIVDMYEQMRKLTEAAYLLQVHKKAHRGTKAK